MKKNCVLIIILLVSFFVRAQSLTDSQTQVPSNDSLSVMFQHLARTNNEIVSINNSLGTHVAIVGVGGTMQVIGSIIALTKKDVKAGTILTLVGTAVLAASFFAMPKGVHLDENGLIIDLPKEKKNPKKKDEDRE